MCCCKLSGVFVKGQLIGADPGSANSCAGLLSARRSKAASFRGKGLPQEFEAVLEGFARLTTKKETPPNPLGFENYNLFTADLLSLQYHYSCKGWNAGLVTLAVSMPRIVVFIIINFDLNVLVQERRGRIKGPRRETSPRLYILG